ncbi:Major sperm protein [Dirofilaria immitis]|nr:Major sperm protein [Dirofilaria immitis]
MAMNRSTMSTTSSMMTGGARPIDHTPNENEFQMTLIPETKIIFMSADIGIKPTTVKVIIENDTPLIQAFKIKCTANRMFTIRPSYGIIVPNEKKKTCNMTPRQMFENFKPDGVKRIQCQFKYADGRPVYPPEPISVINSIMMNPFDPQATDVRRSGA